MTIDRDTFRALVALDQRHRHVTALLRHLAHGEPQITIEARDGQKGRAMLRVEPSSLALSAALRAALVAPLAEEKKRLEAEMAALGLDMNP